MTQFKGVEKALRMDLQRCWGFVKQGKPVPIASLDAIRANHEKIRSVIANEGCGHLEMISPRKLSWVIGQIGVDRVVVLARQNLTPFLFMQAVQKELKRVA